MKQSLTLCVLLGVGCVAPSPAPEPAPNPNNPNNLPKKGAEPDSGAPGKTEPKAQSQPQPKEADKPQPARGGVQPGKTPRQPTVLPAGFSLRGKPVVNRARLGPAPTWRQVLGRLTNLRVDASTTGQELLATLEPGAFHVTDRGGKRRTWRFPPGLRLAGSAHIVFYPDLTARVYRSDGRKAPAADEVVVVDGNVESGEQFRLIVKGGRTIRSIPKPG